MASTSRPRKKLSLRITDYSDRELLALLADLVDAEGHVEVADVAAQIWPVAVRDTRTNAQQCVSIRLSHMRRIGVVDKVEGQHGVWELTDLGRATVSAHTSAALERAVLESETGQELEIMSLVGDLYDAVPEETATLMRREFQFRQYRRRWS